MELVVGIASFTAYYVRRELPGIVADHALSLMVRATPHRLIRIGLAL